MFVVAILELHGAPEDAAPGLAADLGVTPYEARLLVVGGSPSVVLTTATREDAVALLGRLLARGHGVVACDGAAIVPSSAMVSMKRFSFEVDALCADEDRLPYDDVFALLPATHKVTTDSRTQDKTRKLALGRAFVTGGLAITKTVTKEARAVTEDWERVLYVFPEERGDAVDLRQSGTHFGGLGAAMTRSALENVQAMVSELRARAPDAIYDERLLSLRKTTERARVSGNASATTFTSSSEAAMDIAAHLLALWHHRARAR